MGERNEALDIGVIGSGISGPSAAWLLAKNDDVTRSRKPAASAGLEHRRSGNDNGESPSTPDSSLQPCQPP